MRLGIFGGSFDPVHNAHLALARCCRDQAKLDEVWLTPTAVQPFKQQGPVASDADRLAMLHAAVDNEAGLAVCPMELDRGGVSYTVDTLSAIARQHRDAKLFLLMGADTLADLPNWREPSKILALASPLVVHRAGEPMPETDAQIIPMPAMDISSSEIRRRIAAGKSVAGLAPEKVLEYIQQRRLYGGSSCSP